MKSRFIGNIYDGCWKCISLNKKYYTLRNIYNENEIVVHYHTLLRIEQGKTSVSKIWRYNNITRKKKMNLFNQ